MDKAIGEAWLLSWGDQEINERYQKHGRVLFILFVSSLHGYRGGRCSADDRRNFFFSFCKCVSNWMQIAGNDFLGSWCGGGPPSGSRRSTPLAPARGQCFFLIQIRSLIPKLVAALGSHACAWSATRVCAARDLKFTTFAGDGGSLLLYR